MTEAQLRQLSQKAGQQQEQLAESREAAALFRKMLMEHSEDLAISAGALTACGESGAALERVPDILEEAAGKARTVALNAQTEALKPGMASRETVQILADEMDHLAARLSEGAQAVNGVTAESVRRAREGAAGATRAEATLRAVSSASKRMETLLSRTDLALARYGAQLETHATAVESNLAEVAEAGAETEAQLRRELYALEESADLLLERFWGLGYAKRKAFLDAVQPVPLEKGRTSTPDKKTEVESLVGAARTREDT